MNKIFFLVGCQFLLLSCQNSSQGTLETELNQECSLRRKENCSTNKDGNIMTFKNSQEDPYLWLEEVESKEALAWVDHQNVVSKQALQQHPDFEPLRQRILSALNSKERIPYVKKEGPYCYNFWRDETHVRGILRRTSLEEYVDQTPNWDLVLDLDALAAEENENWVWKGDLFLHPTYDRALVFLSRGGTDSVVVREFDLEQKKFVDGGFYLPEAKSDVSWKDRDTLYVGTEFGPNTLTSSGYPKIIKEWKRGTSFSEASQIFEGCETDVSVSVHVIHDHGITYECLAQSPTFFTNQLYLRKGDKWIQLSKPADAKVTTYGSYLLLTLQSDWTLQLDNESNELSGEKHRNEITYPAGALLAIDCDQFLRGDRSFDVLFEATDRSSLAGISSTKNFLIVQVLDHLQNKVFLYQKIQNGWSKTEISCPPFGGMSIHGIDPEYSDAYFMQHSDYLTPNSLWFGNLSEGSQRKLQSLPPFFSAEDLEIQQYEAISKDGTAIPYFQVSKKNLRLDGSHPTLLYGYGGFQISLLPAYQIGRGAGWLEQGYVYVEANIRGGGEFGPKWHEAARKERRQLSYDDFIAVAEHLISRKVTTPQKLGIQGGSNGGLLMGVMLTQRPDLWNAVLCQVPLLDMKRYHRLLAGASWMDEYGNPEKETEWEFIQKYSPYHNLQKEKNYPAVLFTTSTKDDRVHPGHARKMTAKMQDLGYKVFYYENREGGHAGASNNPQIAYNAALSYAFLKQQLSDQESSFDSDRAGASK